MLSWTSGLAFCVMFLVALYLFRTRSARTSGWWLLVLSPPFLAVSAFLRAGTLDPVGPGAGLTLLVEATGAVLLAAGLLAWGRASALDLIEAGRRELTLSHQAEVLESRLKVQAEQLRDALAVDDVSGVLNRREFLKRLEEAVNRDSRLGKSMAFLLIDIEGFRLFNAQHGRMAGDTILKHVGRSLRSVSRGTDFVGRVGGDEFAVALGQCDDPQPVVSRLFVTLHGSAPVPGAPSPQVSVGAVLVERPETGIDVGALFRLAEEALASVRGTGGGRCGKRILKPNPDLVPVRV